MSQPPSNERIRIRGLAFVAAAILVGWGGLVLAKGLWDLGWGQPEANLYSARPWMFVTREEWRRYAAFEAVYGAACLALAWAIRRYARVLPEIIERQRQEPEIKLFD